MYSSNSTKYRGSLIPTGGGGGGQLILGYGSLNAVVLSSTCTVVVSHEYFSSST